MVVIFRTISISHLTTSLVLFIKPYKKIKQEISVELEKLRTNVLHSNKRYFGVFGGRKIAFSCKRLRNNRVV